VTIGDGHVTYLDPTPETKTTGSSINRPSGHTWEDDFTTADV
jgi:hypothetical protein